MLSMSKAWESYEYAYNTLKFLMGTLSRCLFLCTFKCITPLLSIKFLIRRVSIRIL